MEAVILWAAMGIAALGLLAVVARDLPFVLDRRHRVMAVVIGHQRLHEDGNVVHAAVLSFIDHRGGEHRVVDALLSAARRPPIGTRVRIVFPERRPFLARVPRPLSRAAIYVAIGFTIAGLWSRIHGWPA